MAMNLQEMVDARNALNSKISDIEHAEKKREMAAHVGEYLKYPKNCYSCPKKASDYWPIYAHVESQARSGELNVVEFQTTSLKEYTLRHSEWFYPHYFNSYVQISKREYEAAKKKFIRAVSESLGKD